MTTAELLDTNSKLSGVVRTVHFYAPDSGFSIFELKTEYGSVSIKGMSGKLSEGDYVECAGEWEKHKTYGDQFSAKSILPSIPSSVKGMETYLASGVIQGIGKTTAKELVKHFGTDVFDVIENAPHRLKRVKGIGKKRLYQIISDWDEQSGSREAIVFLGGCGVTAATAANIYKVHGEHTIDRVRNNPYLLADSINGIGFLKADTIAIEMGIAPDSKHRLKSAANYQLNQAVQDGNCAQEREQLAIDTAKLTKAPIELIRTAIKDEIEQGNLKPAEIRGKPCVYPRDLWHAEQETARHLHRIATFQKGGVQNNSVMRSEDEMALKELLANSDIPYSESQRAALRHVVSDKVLVLTGGPGSGKTTLTAACLKLMESTCSNPRIVLCAPTGRAAKRLSESTGREAATIHRTLQYSQEKRGFEFDENNPLEADLVVVDEASMLDIKLARSLLKAVPGEAKLIIVGDIDQLQSVGAGRVLHDVIASEKVPVVRLTEVHRQALTSDIVANAHRINAGEMPNHKTAGDFFVIGAKDADEVHRLVLKAVSERIPAKFNVNPISGIQLLAPMHKGACGVGKLNTDLQELLNGNSHPRLTYNHETYAPGDKVIHIKNNIQADVYNGDLGIVREVDVKEKTMVVMYDGRPVEYETKMLRQLRLAYCTTVHKSQGSEYPVVVVPLTMQHYVLLERNLLYTAVTRGKQAVLVIAEESALKRAVKNKTSSARLTNLSTDLIKAFERPTDVRSSADWAQGAEKRWNR